MTSVELVEAAKSQFALAINAALIGRGNVEVNPFSILDEIRCRLDSDLVGRQVRSKKVRHKHDAIITEVEPAKYWLGRADGSLGFSNPHLRDDFELLDTQPQCQTDTKTKETP